jgi:hypothetical protein
MKKIITVNRTPFFSNLIGPVDDTILKLKNINDLKKDGETLFLKMVSLHEGGETLCLVTERYETDLEYDKRINEEKKENDFKIKQIEKEIKELEVKKRKLQKL